MSEEISFEKAIAELESIVETLESGQQPLDKSIKLFSKGTLMVSICEKKLKEAEVCIEELV